MDIISINQQVYICRSDGRIHQARIIKLDGSTNNITVEWKEGKFMRGKEMPLETIIKLNPQIYGGATMTRSNMLVAIAKRPVRPERLVANGSDAPRLTAGSAAMPTVVMATPRQLIKQRQDNVVKEIDRLRSERERRRQQQNATRAMRQSLMEADPGNPHWEIACMLRLYRQHMKISAPECPAHSPAKQHQIVVCVRKRPLNRRELAMHEPDVVSVPNREHLVVHEPRKQVDLTKFLEHHSFRFDHTFDEDCTNTYVYERTAQPLVAHIFEGGMATCFAYGQTGSGKTHTMGGEFTDKHQSFRDGIYALAAADVFESLQQPSYANLNLSVSCSFFELYGTQIYDLLKPSKRPLRMLEDEQQQVQVVDLTEPLVRNKNDVLQLLELGNSLRTWGQTSANNKSSRSHAVFQIVLRAGPQRCLHGKFSLIDLAGNERGADNCCADRRTRFEGSEINKSLLALKECIRALGRQSPHLPFRGSRLTQVLRDSFIGGKKVRTCMIAMISPSLRSVEHTLNTLRYADRVKELTVHPTMIKDSAPLAQTSSLPHIVRQPNQPLSRASSTASLPGSVTEPMPSQIQSIWKAYTAVHVLEDSNLAYFNEATDNYGQPAARTASTK